VVVAVGRWTTLAVVHIPLRELHDADDDRTQEEIRVHIPHRTLGIRTNRQDTMEVKGSEVGTWEAAITIWVGMGTNRRILEPGRSARVECRCLSTTWPPGRHRHRSRL
jgi:hypothetical protein